MIAGVVGVGLRVRRQVTPGSAVWWQVTPDCGVLYLAAPGNDGCGHERERERDRRPDENRHSCEYAGEELCVDHLMPPGMIVFTPFT